MKYLKNFTKYKESLDIDISLLQIDINESLNLFYENILSSIGAEEVDFLKTFNIERNQDIFKNSLDDINNSPEFIKILRSIGLRKSNLQSTADFETFVNKPCRFIMIYRYEANDLENPSYIIFQSKKTEDKSGTSDTNIGEWENPKLYKVTGEIKSFYDKLASKVIEIIDGEENYIYQSSNKNEWTLQNIDKATDRFKKYFRKEEFEKFINDNKFKFDIK